MYTRLNSRQGDVVLFSAVPIITNEIRDILVKIQLVRKSHVLPRRCKQLPRNQLVENLFSLYDICFRSQLKFGANLYAPLRTHHTYLRLRVQVNLRRKIGGLPPLPLFHPYLRFF